MATKKKETATVTRIKASEPVSKKSKKETAANSVVSSTAATKSKRRSAKGIFAPFKAIGGYFKGAWVELRQVRWPTRRATWSLTGAVLLFTGFFVVLVLLLDALFKYIFELIIG